MKRTATLTLACLALLGAGCGSSDDDEPSGGGSAPAGESGGAGGREIKMVNIRFDPVDADVKVGEKVTWVNEDDVEHNAIATEGKEFESENFGKGGTYSYTPEKAGTINYTCTLHPGMDGVLNVTG